MKRIQSLAPIMSYLFSPILVALTTLLMSFLMNRIAAVVPNHTVRPFGIAFILPIAISAAIGGRGPGLLAAACCIIGFDSLLGQQPTSMRLHDPRNIIEMSLMFAVGLLVIAGIDAMQRNIRLLENARGDSERESLMNRIKDFTRDCVDADKIQQYAVYELGMALHADRCYFLIYDALMDSAEIGQDWTSPEHSATHRRFSPSSIGWDFAALFASGQPLVFDQLDSSPLDDRQRSTLRAGKVEAAIAVPVYSVDELTAILIVIDGQIRSWKKDEVSLVEAVADQTLIATESARIRIRERNIASTLQEALLAPTPPQIPGLSIAPYYRPALNDANVGGDFYDVYKISDDCYALVIGDVSGKGLIAAAQVAAVRNMLRCLLITESTVASAVTRLNIVLTRQQLLNGFATMFVGLFDSHRGTLVYVSCGHEPALLQRQGAEIEHLESTGMPLGISETSEYEEAHVSIAPGDKLLIYTDGFTDSGPKPSEYLMVKGLSDLFVFHAQAAPDPQTAVKSIVESVRKRASDHLGDDACLLLAVADRHAPRDPIGEPAVL